MKSRSKLMFEKSVAAMLSAIEIYNKPDFKYRGEDISVICDIRGQTTVLIPIEGGFAINPGN